MSEFFTGHAGRLELETGCLAAATGLRKKMICLIALRVILTQDMLYN